MENVMKKIIVCLVIFMLFPLVSLADEKMEFILNEEVNDNDEEVEINLSLKNNPGFGYLGLEIVFDQEKLEYVSSQVTGMANALLKGAELNEEGNISIYALQVNSNKLINDNDKIVKIKFKIKEEFLNTKIDFQNVSVGKDENTPIAYTTKSIELKKELKENVILEDKKSLKDEVSNFISEDTKYEDIKWKSTNEDIVEIDDGNIVFKNPGKATIIGQINDETIYEKQFLVKKEFNYLLLIIPIAILIIGLIIFLVKKKKEKSKKNK